MNETKKQANLNSSVAEFFNFKSEIATKVDKKNIKIKLAPFFVLIENDLLSVFGKTRIEEADIKNELFQNRYKYIYSNYSTAQIMELLRILRVCRNTVCHFLVRTNKSIHKLSEPELLDGLSFFDETVCHVDGQITMQGMFSLMILFASNEEANKLIDTVSSLTELGIGKYFYRKNEELGLKSEENCFRIKNELKRRFKDINNFSFDADSSASIRFFDYNFLAKASCDLIFNVKSFFYKQIDSPLCTNHSNFYDALGSCAEEETKEAWHQARNSWAHGDFSGIRKEQPRALSSLLIDASEMLKADVFAPHSKSSYKMRRFVENVTEEFAQRILSYKYHRLVELAIKLSLPEEYEPEKRVIAMANYAVNESIVSHEDEKRLINLLNGNPVAFSFKHKIKSKPIFNTNSIELSSFTLPEGAYALINGIRIDNTAFNVSYVEGCAQPTLQIYDSCNEPLKWRAVNSLDLGFFKRTWYTIQ